MQVQPLKRFVFEGCGMLRARRTACTHTRMHGSSAAHLQAVVVARHMQVAHGVELQAHCILRRLHLMRERQRACMHAQTCMCTRWRRRLITDRPSPDYTHARTHACSVTSAWLDGHRLSGCIYRRMCVCMQTCMLRLVVVAPCTGYTTPCNAPGTFCGFRQTPTHLFPFSLTAGYAHTAKQTNP